jgi:hypothetical protein
MTEPMPDAPRYWNSSLFGNGVSMGTERRAVVDEARLFLGRAMSAIVGTNLRFHRYDYPGNDKHHSTSAMAVTMAAPRSCATTIRAFIWTGLVAGQPARFQPLGQEFQQRFRRICLPLGRDVSGNGVSRPLDQRAQNGVRVYITFADHADHLGEDVQRVGSIGGNPLSNPCIHSACQPSGRVNCGVAPLLLRNAKEIAAQ